LAKYERGVNKCDKDYPTKLSGHINLSK